ncbi:MAG: transposase, partial [Planctomycetaceae bacterium]|nr:transposase [Planctomycetaceae bacterium]
MSNASSHIHLSFFDIECQLDKIHALNDFLVRLNILINWSIFLAPLSTLRSPCDPSQGGRPSFDSLLMFNILILKTPYHLSDENTELLIRGRLSFREFLGLRLSDVVPDARTIWLFAGLLQEQDMERHLFALFHEELARHGLAAKIVGNSNSAIPNATLYEFGIITSAMHNAWMRHVCGRLEIDYRYSGTLVYNNFPFPNPTDKQRQAIESAAQAILDIRAKYPKSNLADLYDPLTMPVDLLKAHQKLDKAVEKAY